MTRFPIRLFPMLLLGILLAGCTKNEFSIEFDLPSDVSANYRLVYFASDRQKGWIVETVAPVTRGKASLKGQTRLPALIYVFQGSGTPATILYASRGDRLTVTGSGSDPRTWSVKGNSLSSRTADWIRSHSAAFASPVSLNRAIASQVEREPDEKLSLLLLYALYDRRADEAGFRSLCSKLPNKLRSDDLMRLLSQGDILSGALPQPGKVGDMILKSAGRGIDTLRPARARATLLVFASRQSPHFIVDSLRSLRRQWPDSARHAIARMALTQDSLVWRATLRADSLKGILNAWVPRGVADEYLLALGVTRTPYYIVTDPSRRQLYRGDDLPQALSAFRRAAAGAAKSGN